jgi:hypothetical protein
MKTLKGIRLDALPDNLLGQLPEEAVGVFSKKNTFVIYEPDQE